MLTLSARMKFEKVPSKHAERTRHELMHTLSVRVRNFLSYILLVLKADLHLMLGMYIQLRHPIIHDIGDFYPIITR
jgi:hypothetical protein